MSDPRIRERRVQVARDRGRRRRRVLVALFVLVALVAGGLVLVHSSVFGARHVRIVGAQHVTDAEVLAASGLSNAPPLIDISTSVVAARVERLPWVDTAKVTMSWPSTVTIALTERTPVAAVAGPGTEWSVVDPSGRVLEQLPTRPPALPLVASAVPPPAPGGNIGKRTAALAVVAAAMPESMVSGTKEITYAGGSIAVDLTDSLVALLGNPHGLRDKFVALATVLHHGGLTGIGTIDVRVPSAPVLLPKTATSTSGHG